MNKENLLRVADAIEKHEIEWLGYNQGTWIQDDVPDMSKYDCGTSACIAGWTIAVAHAGKSKRDIIMKLYMEDDISIKASFILDLTLSERIVLFYAQPFIHKEPDATDAVAVLRYAAKHGIVDWYLGNRND